MRPLLFSLLLLIPAVAAESEPMQTKPRASSTESVATVDLQTLFANYRKTLQAEREINNERAAIEKRSQAANNLIRERRESLASMRLLLESNTVPSEEKEQIQREGPVLLREIKMLERQNEQKRESATRQLDQQMFRRMNAILGEITTVSAEYARQQGYQLLYDVSGKNSSQVLPILYAKNSRDITEELALHLSVSDKKKK